MLWSHSLKANRLSQQILSMFLVSWLSMHIMVMLGPDFKPFTVYVLHCSMWDEKICHPSCDIVFNYTKYHNLFQSIFIKGIYKQYLNVINTITNYKNLDETDLCLSIMTHTSVHIHATPYTGTTLQ